MFEFLYSLSKANAFLEAQMSICLDYLAGAGKPGWMPKGLERKRLGINKVIVLEGWYLRHLVFLQGQPATHSHAYKCIPLLNEVLWFCHIGNSALFKR